MPFWVDIRAWCTDTLLSKIGCKGTRHPAKNCSGNSLNFLFSNSFGIMLLMFLVGSINEKESVLQMWFYIVVENNIER